MTTKFNQVLDGKFVYSKNNQVYGEENFWLENQGSSRGDFLFGAEILSRSHNGEFLKIQVKYLTSYDFNPKRVEINRFMGERESAETFEIDEAQQAIEYFFFDGNNTHRETKSIKGVFQIATPSFASSLLVTQKKRLDTLQRSQYTVVSSENIWNYDSQLNQKEISIELVELDPVSIKVRDQNLKATHCSISSLDGELSDVAASKKPEDIFLSKHYSIPYKGVFKDGVVIEIEKLNIT